MFEVTVEDSFAAGHYLRNYKGKCEKPHGHNYKIRVTLAGKELDKKMTVVEEALIQTKSKSSQDVLNFPIRLNNQMAALGGVVGSADSAPTKQSYEVFDMLSKTVDEQLAKWQSVVTTDVKSYNDLIKQQDVPALLVKPPSEAK